MEDLNRRGQTILLVTHDEQLATATAHRIIRLIDGRIAADQPTRMAA
jgi:ABC-type ATPase involved in cell division